MGEMPAKEAIRTMKIDMVETAKGCSEGCIHCGAYEGFDNSEDSIVKPLSRAELEAHLTQEIIGAEAEGTRVRVADCLAELITTGVNTEPLLSDAFIDLAELAHEISGGNSRAICISHGLKTGSTGRLSESRRSMADRLRKIVDLMLKDVVPVFVLTVDLARNKGKITGEANVASYIETLKLLLPALDAGKRVTISLQGDDDPESPYYRARADRVWQHVLENVTLTPQQQANLCYDQGRSYVKAGRARGLIGALSAGGNAPVIPDRKLAEAIATSQSAVPYRGMVDIYGRLWRQFREWANSYGTTVNGPWERLVNGEEDGGAGGPEGKTGGGGGVLRVLQPGGGGHVSGAAPAGPHEISDATVDGTMGVLASLAAGGKRVARDLPAGVKRSAVVV